MKFIKVHDWHYKEMLVNLDYVVEVAGIDSIDDIDYVYVSYGNRIERFEAGWKSDGVSKYKLEDLLVEL